MHTFLASFSLVSRVARSSVPTRTPKVRFGEAPLRGGSASSFSLPLLLRRRFCRRDSQEEEEEEEEEKDSSSRIGFG